MSWEKLAPLATNGDASRAGVEFGVRHGRGRYRRPGGMIILITIRTEKMRPAPRWLAPGKMVSVLLGSAEHLDRLRITPGTEHRLRLPGGKDNRSIVQIVLPKWPHLPDTVRRSAAEFDWSDEWLEVAIPEWAWCRNAANAAPIVKPFAKPGPFRTAAETITQRMR